MKRSRYYLIFAALNRKTVVTQSHTIWADSNFINNPIFAAFEAIRRYCAKIVYVPKITILSLDDDHQQFRNMKLTEQQGLHHVNNPDKRYDKC